MAKVKDRNFGRITKKYNSYTHFRVKSTREVIDRGVNGVKRIGQFLTDGEDVYFVVDYVDGSYRTWSEDDITEIK